MITLETTTFLIGANGSGKTAILQALCRLFAFVPAMRRIQPSDFNVPLDEKAVPAERTLFIEADVELPEANNGEEDQFTIPPCFRHMRLDDNTLTPRVRYRLEASMGQNGDIDEKLSYVTQVDDHDEPSKKALVARDERNYLCVHYIPARRDPSDHIAYGTNSMLGRLLRASDWSGEQDKLKEASKELDAELHKNPVMKGLNENLTATWRMLSKGDFFKEPQLSFSPNNIDSILKQLGLSFSPGHGGGSVDYLRLSDGQKSMLYLSLIIAARALEVETLREGGAIQLDPARTRVPIFTLIAMEEPENSLAPHFLGRIVSILKKSADDDSTQSIVATHAPGMLKRVRPRDIRHIRLDKRRNSKVTKIPLPSEDLNPAHRKFVREAVQAFPEIYFARLVVLGEGDSEEIVLPRIFRDSGLPCDEHGIVVAPLGGRHVNHFWRILAALNIPFITLLDLDLGRHGGGWGRIKYVADQLILIGRDALDADETPENLPEWNSPDYKLLDYPHYISGLRAFGVHFSHPLDLDFTMIGHFTDAYRVTRSEKKLPDSKVIASVLGKKGREQGQYSEESQHLFAAYHSRFKTSSKPASHIDALSRLTPRQLRDALPAQYKELVDAVRAELEAIPE